MSTTALYKAPGQWDIWGHKLDYLACPDEEVEAMLADGWHTDPNAAAEAGKASDPSADKVPADDAPPTRAELEAKATELGIAFRSNVSDAKLAERIAEKLKG